MEDIYLSNIEPSSDQEFTSLMYASSSGCIDIVELLLDMGADVNTKDINGYTALMFAFNEDRKEIIDLLYKHGTDMNIDAKYNEKGYTFLIWYSRYGDIDMVRFLLDSGANTNIQDNTGCTALIHACVEQHMEIIELLLDYGADPNIKSNGETTAIEYAHNFEDKELLNLLCRYGANHNDLNIYIDPINTIMSNLR